MLEQFVEDNNILGGIVVLTNNKLMNEEYITIVPTNIERLNRSYEFLTVIYDGSEKINIIRLLKNNECGKTIVLFLDDIDEELIALTDSYLCIKDMNEAIAIVRCIRDTAYTLGLVGLDHKDVQSTIHDHNKMYYKEFYFNNTKTFIDQIDIQVKLDAILFITGPKNVYLKDIALIVEAFRKGNRDLNLIYTGFPDLEHPKDGYVVTILYN